MLKVQPLGESRQLQHMWSKIQEAQDWVKQIKGSGGGGGGGGGGGSTATRTANVTLRPHLCSCSSRTLPALEYWQDECEYDP